MYDLATQKLVQEELHYVRLLRVEEVGTLVAPDHVDLDLVVLRYKDNPNYSMRVAGVIVVLQPVGRFEEQVRGVNHAVFWRLWKSFTLVLELLLLPFPQTLHEFLVLFEESGGLAQLLLLRGGFFRLENVVRVIALHLDQRALRNFIERLEGLVVRVFFHVQDCELRVNLENLPRRPGCSLVARICWKNRGKNWGGPSSSGCSFRRFRRARRMFGSGKFGSSSASCFLRFRLSIGFPGIFGSRWGTRWCRFSGLGL